jgi:selenide,water dikinase
MQPSHPVTRDLILIGGGHAHALVLRKWGMSPLPGVRVTLITPEPTAPYTGMLPGHVAGHYSRDALDIDLMRLARFAGARVVLKPATGLDLNARQVIVPDRAPVAFDALSINVGIRSTLPDLPGFAEHAIPAKPLGLFADRWARFVEAVEKGEVAARIAVIGCGVAGAELALSMHHRLRDHAPEIVILEAEDALKHASPRARAALERNLRDAGITIREGVQVTRIAADHVETQAGDIPSNFTVGAAGATPLAWVAGTGLPVTDGFIEVGEHLNSPADPTIFAGGDCAHMLHAPREKAGVFAVRQAPILHHNLRATLSGKRLKAYKPQRDYLKLVSLGTKDAVADWHGLAPSGSLLWQWQGPALRMHTCMISFNHACVYACTTVMFLHAMVQHMCTY